MYTLPKLRLITAVIGLLVFFLPLPGAAQGLGSENILIRNVRLIDPSGQTEDRIVNILIRKRNLELVTEDRISRKEADLVLDAGERVIQGKLKIGERPSFIIFSQDPRENFKVLLDTKTYALFAMDAGEVIRNHLIRINYDNPQQEPVKSGWLAYTPPPFAMPLNYQNAKQWNHFESKWVSGLFSGVVGLDRMGWLSQDAESGLQFGNLNTFDGGEIRALRFGVIGTLNFDRPWVYTVIGVTQAFDKGFEIQDEDSFTLFDWRLDIPFFRNSVMSLGKQKEPISMERLNSLVFLPMLERSAVADALLPSRNIGLVWNGSNPEKYTSWAFGVFNDWFDEGQDFNDSTTTYVSRFTWAPLRSEDKSNLVHLGVGYRYSDLTEGFRFRTTPEFNKAPVFVDTGFGTEAGTLPGNHGDTINLEFSWRKGPYLLTSEYYRTQVSNPMLDNPVFNGYYVSASWIPTGEMRPYSTKNGLFGSVPVSRSVYQNGKGAWEFSMRYSGVDLSDGQVYGGEMQIASLGVNWWLTPFFSFGVNYRYIWNQQGEQEGRSSGLVGRILLMLE